MYFHSAPNRKKGRVTVAGVLINDNTLLMGAAKCSKHDLFVKKVGRDKAHGRALSKRTQIGALPVHVKPEELSVGKWFKQLAEECSKRIMKGIINPTNPNGLNTHTA